MQSNGCHIKVTQHSLFPVTGNLDLVAGTLFLQEEFISPIGILFLWKEMHYCDGSFVSLQALNPVVCFLFLWQEFSSCDRHSCDRKLNVIHVALISFLIPVESISFLWQEFNFGGRNFILVTGILFWGKKCQSCG